MLKAVLLDVDGTLIDSNDAHARAWIDALSEGGFDVPYDKVRSRIGKGGDKLLPEVTGLTDESPDAKRISARCGEIFAERYLPTVRPFPQARALLERMKRDRLALVVASSAREEQLSPLLRVAEVDDLVEARTSSGDADHSKPDPDIVRVALRRAGCSSKEAILLGDTPYDLEAAKRAGVAAVAVRSGGWTTSALAGALAIYDDVAQLLREYASSPFSS